jgi:hypothetical protein
MHFDSHRAHLKSCAGPGVGAWLSIHIAILFQLPSKVFPTMLWIQCGFPHPLNLSLSHCICGRPLEPMGIHLFSSRPWWGKDNCHGVVRDAFTSIMKDVRFYILLEQTHVLPSPIFQSMC